MLYAATANAAEPAPVQASADYILYARGLQIAALRAEYRLGAWSYRVQLAYHTTGLAGVLFRGHQRSVAEGGWAGLRAAPGRFATAGEWRGTPRETVIDYVNGQPAVRSMVPPNEDERDPVPAALQADTIDTLSALAQLIWQVQARGRCDGQTTTFDGRRLADITARTAGEEVLAPTARSSFSGPALRCDFEGRQRAGFLRGEDQARLRRPQAGSAWLAPVEPGGPPVPVRIAFETRWFGTTTMYLAKPGSSGE